MACLLSRKALKFVSVPIANAIQLCAVVYFKVMTNEDKPDTDRRLMSVFFWGDFQLGAGWKSTNRTAMLRFKNGSQE